MPTYQKTALALGLSFCICATVLADSPVAKPIPAHPDDLVYAPLDYRLPPADQFREVLPNGMVVYIAEDRMFPTFDMSVTIRTGGAFDPPGKAGLASLMGEQIRDGGTENLSPEELDERVDFLAAGLMSYVSDTRGNANLSVLSKDLDDGLALLIDMLRHPRFDERRLQLAKERIVQQIKRRNDSTDSIESIEWDFLMNGDAHFSTRYPSSESIDAINREDLLAFHRKYYHPGNMIVTVSGDFDRTEMLNKISKAFADWPIGEPGPTTFPAPQHQPVPGVYVVDKEGVNQGRVSIGHKSIMRGSPDEFPLRIMNAILGGSGFQSRLTGKIRSDEGLAYTVGSQFGQGAYYPGDFQCYFQTKSNACAYATGLALAEIDRIRTEKVDQDDLDVTISLLTEYFPQQFPTIMAVLNTYANDEYTGRDPAYWQTYTDNLKKVTVDDVLRVAKKYLHPDELVILVVGETDTVIAGGHDKNPDLHLDFFGKVTRLPLRDPDTLTR